MFMISLDIHEFLLKETQIKLQDIISNLVNNFPFFFFFNLSGTYLQWNVTI